MANVKTVFVILETKKGYPSMLQTAKALGKSRIRPDQLEKLGVKEMTEEEFEAFKNEATADNQPEAPKAEEVVTAEPVVENKEVTTEEPTPEPEEEEETEEPTPEELAEVAPVTDSEEPEPTEDTPETPEEPEASEEDSEEEEESTDEEDSEEEETEEADDDEALSFESIDEFVETMKGMSGEEVIELAQGLNLEWNENANKGINRMRASIALREHFFPGQRRPSGPKSPWKKVPYSEIEAIAKANDLQWTITEDEKINRMWAIHALNKAGITPPVKAEETVEAK